MGKKTGALIVVLTAGLLANQNCSQVAFNTKLSSTVVPKCRDLGSPELKPRLLWDWRTQLAGSPDSRFPSWDQVMSAPMVADLDGDHVSEVVFVTFSPLSADWYPDSVATAPHHRRNGVLRIVEGRTGRTKASVGSQELAPLADTSPLLMDIDGDGKVEIFYIDYRQSALVALNYDGSKRWIFAFPNGGVISMAPTGPTGGDSNRNGIGEIFIGPYIVTEAAGQPLLQTTLATLSLSHISPLAIPLDPSTPGDWSLVHHSGIYRVDGNIKSTFASATGFLAAADVDPSSPGLELISTGNEKLEIINGLSGAMIRSINLRQFNSLQCPSGTVGGGPPTIGDFDGDPATLEIAVVTGRHLTIFDTQGTPKFKVDTQDCSSLSTGLTSFDLNGDKKPEVLYADEEYLRILEVRNGQLVTVYQLVNPSGTLHEYPIVADIQGNGQAALIVASNNYAVSGFYKDAGEAADGVEALGVTGVRAFVSSSENSWMPTRPIWNQHAFHPDLVTDGARFLTSPQLDGSIFRRNNQGYNLTLACRP